jgi:hypothetical protein
LGSSQNLPKILREAASLQSRSRPQTYDLANCRPGKLCLRRPCEVAAKRFNELLPWNIEGASFIPPPTQRKWPALAAPPSASNTSSCGLRRMLMFEALFEADRGDADRCELPSFDPARLVELSPDLRGFFEAQRAMLEAERIRADREYRRVEGDGRTSATARQGI